MRKTFGNTWWGQQWLNSLSSIDYSNRLPRGRRYANNGSVLEIETNKNSIRASVRGSRPRPYNVEYEVPTFDEKQKKAIITLIVDNPSFLSSLLNRKLPIELNDACAKIGIYLFPNSWKDLPGACSCPDHASPCKHMAAVLYLVSNEIDKNPFVVFQLHDFDLFESLAKNGYADKGEKGVAIPTLDNLVQAFNVDKNVDKWNKTLFQQLDFSNLPDCKTDLLSIVTENPVFYPGGDFKAELEKAYKNIPKKLAKNKFESEEILSVNQEDTIESIDIILDENINFKIANLRDKDDQPIHVFKNIDQLINWVDQISFSELVNFSTAVKGVYLAWLLSKKLIAASAFIPQLLQVKKGYKIRWIPAILNPMIKERLTQVSELLPKDILYYKKGKKVLEPNELDKLPALFSFFLNYIVDQHHQLNLKKEENEIIQLFFHGSIEPFNSFEEQEYPPSIQLWLNKFYIFEKEQVPVVQIQEVEEEGGFEVNVGIEDKKNPLDPPIPLFEIMTNKAYKKLKLDVLRDVSMIAEYFPQINTLLNSKINQPLFFDANEFVEILFKILPTIKLFGLKVLLPKSLRKLMRPKLSMVVEGDESGVVNQNSLVNMNTLLSFDWSIAIGDQQISPPEFLDMVEQFSGIVKLNDQYVYFDENEIKSLIAKMENPPALEKNQLLHIALTEDYQGAKVELDESARDLIKHLLSGEGAEVPKGLKATLRPYQLSGFEWLYKNSRLGFGSLIADDMGLGKTLQVITTILKLKEDGALEKQKALAIVPTTLLTNWQKEIEKFAPSLRSHIYHGPKRSLDQLEEVDVLLTTYGVIRTEGDKLSKKKWLLLVIDEAQNIKNPSTSQTKAVKKIKAGVKIAMSGTPVENRLSEYWSIFDFANKGYLGNLAKFKEEFAKPIEIERNQTQLDQFRKITEPFILRRLKSDRTIIQDLPDKIEQDQFCVLTKEQSALYQNVVDTTMQTIAAKEGIERKGLVLKLITALKQICNHPKQFLKKGIGDAALSGKAQLLVDLLKPILDNGEKSLIFTQYQEMGKLLTTILADNFNLEVPFLHGGVSRKKRDEMVEDFQNNRSTRIMILSLKAGGTGLNLTAASNVIHYDLWWNPAVEAQATDRAYRIGQERNVMVHRFICQGTFEEKINELLQVKKELANLTVANGEKWIGNYSDDELKDLVSLA